MKRMLSLLCLVSVLVAAPLFAVDGERCCGKPRPGRVVSATDKCGCNKPKTTTRAGEATDKCGCNKPNKSCGSCNSCNSCNNKPCCGR